MKVCLILCDALRFDRVNQTTMPYLSEQKHVGTSFEMFFANGGTTKWSMPHFLSGKREYDPVNNFPKILTENAIKTTIIHSNAVLVNEKYQNCFSKHKDVGVEMAPIQQTARNLLRHNPIWKAPRNLRKRIKGTIETPYRLAENIFKSAQKQFDLSDNGFYWIHLMDSHIPYCTPSLSGAKKLRADELYEKVLSNINDNTPITPEESLELAELYDDECNYMDAEIKKFIEANKDTVFIVTSDHGEMFGETGSYSHGPYYHGMTLQLGHIPFIVTGPGVKKSINFDYHSSIEVGSTILDMFDIPIQCGYGKSFKTEVMK